MVKKVKTVKTVSIAPIESELIEEIPIDLAEKKEKKEKKVRKPNRWLIHVREYRLKNPTVSYKDCLKQAKLTYIKGAALPSKPVKIKKEPATEIVKKAVKKKVVKKIVTTKEQNKS